MVNRVEAECLSGFRCGDELYLSEIDKFLRLIDNDKRKGRNQLLISDMLRKWIKIFFFKFSGICTPVESSDSKVDLILFLVKVFEMGLLFPPPELMCIL